MTLAEAQERAGAVRSPEGGPPLHYGDAARELDSARKGAGLVDLSDRGRLELRGSRRLDYLHRVTAQSFLGLDPPRGTQAAVLERTGKIIDVITVHAFDDRLLAIASAAHRVRLRDWLGKFIFREDVQLIDRTEETGALLLVGPRAGEVAAALAGPAAATLLPLCWAEFPAHPGAILLRWLPVGAETYAIVGPAGGMAEIWGMALARGAPAGLVPVGTQAFQALRILAGFPDGGSEIDDASNPLELGLDETMDLGKGCFTGQEAVAKMITHRGVKRRLAGVELGDAPIPPAGTILRTASDVVGRITSAAETPDTGRRVALALIRREHGGPGTRLRLGEEDEAPEVTVMTLPFPERTRE